MAADGTLPGLAIEARAAANRKANPEAAAFVDQVRAVFPGAVVTYLGPARPHPHLQASGDRLASQGCAADVQDP